MKHPALACFSSDRPFPAALIVTTDDVTFRLTSRNSAQGIHPAKHRIHKTPPISHSKSDGTSQTAPPRHPTARFTKVCVADPYEFFQPISVSAAAARNPRRNPVVIFVSGSQALPWDCKLSAQPCHAHARGAKVKLSSSGVGAGPRKANRANDLRARITS